MKLAIQIISITFILMLVCFSSDNRLSSSALAQSPDNDWNFDCLYCPRSIVEMSSRSLQLDSQDRPHLVYWGSLRLYYATTQDMGWQFEEIDRSSGYGIALALDDLERPHASYIALGPGILNGDLIYAWRDGDDWQSETVEEAIQDAVQNDTVIALDNLGQPHILYFSGVWKYARRLGSTWQIEAIPNPEAVALGLALDQAGRPHMALFDTSDERLKYGWFDGATWQFETVPSETSDYIRSATLILDGTDQPHLAYYAPSTLKYTWRDGSGWHTETVSASRNRTTIKAPSMAIDESNHPHIGYGLTYAHYNGASWQIQAVDQAWSSQGSSLALNQAGQPVVAYISRPYSQYQNLKYAQFDGIAWQLNLIDSQPDIAYMATLYAGEQLYAVHFDPTSAALKYMRFDQLSRQEQTIETGAAGDYVYAEPLTLALDENGHPHTVFRTFHLPYQVQTRYAWYDGTSWHSEFIAGETSFYPLIHDRSGHPHTAFYLDYDLRYEWYDETGLHSDTIYSIDPAVDLIRARYARVVALELDQEGHPHLVHYECLKEGAKGGCITNNLMYSYHDGLNWHTDTMPERHPNWQRALLRLDQANRPYIVKSVETQDGSSIDLTYNWRDAEGWHTEKLDGLEALHFVLDKRGRPQIIYLQNGPSNNIDIKHTWRNGDQWQTSVIDQPALDPWPDMEFAVDRDGRTHFVYEYDDQLKYASQLNDDDWQLETIENGSAYGFPIALFLNLKNEPQIILRSGRHYTYAYRPNLYLNVQASPGQPVHNHEPFTYTLTLAGPGLNVHLADPLPHNVQYLSDSLTSTLTPAPAYHPLTRTVTWQGTLPGDGASLVQFRVTPASTGTGSLALAEPIVNTAWLTDTERKTGIWTAHIANGRTLHLPVIAR